MVTLEELTKPLTAAQVEAAIYSAIAAKGITASSWKPGAVVRTIIAALAIALAAITVLVSLVARGGFLELATGPWLDLVAYHVYDTRRIEATFATGFVKLTNDTGVGSFSFVAPGDLVVKRADGKTYRNTETFSLPAVISASVTVPIQADEAGSASTASAGEIDQFVTLFVGCSVTNEAGLVGTDRETDTSLRERARAKTGTLSPNGPRDAYVYVALSAQRADGTSIGVTRVRSIADGAGNVAVYVADADGSLTGTADDPATDLGAVAEAIHTQVEPLAVTPTVRAATPVPVPVTYELWVDSAIGRPEDTIKSQVEDTLATYLGSVPIGGEVIPGVSGGYIYRSAIEAAITSVVGTDHLIRCSLTTPAADVPMSVSDAPLKGTVTPVVHLVSSGVI